MKWDDIFAAYGEQGITDRIEAGETYKSLAESFGAPVSCLHRWINADADRAHRAAVARTASAEAWLDRGLAPLERAVDGAPIDAAAARAYEQACARRAAIRNPIYSDKQRVEHSGGLEVSRKAAAHMTDAEILALVKPGKS